MVSVHSLILLLLFRGMTAQVEEPAGPRFRILAPQFVCPKDDAAVDASNTQESVIRLQMPAGETASMEWTVRWKSHGALTQRVTIMLWQAVRALEAELNCAPPEPYTYVIRNDKLLPGIDYIFNTTAVSADGVRGQSANFSIAYEDGKRTLNLQETVTRNKFSVMLLGSETTYAHVDYTLEAQVHTCIHTDDYQFAWTVKDFTDALEEIDVSGQLGAQLLIPGGTFRGGHQYDITCHLLRASDQQFITKVGIFLEVERRGLGAELNVDELVVGVGRPVYITSTVHNYDNLPPPLTLEWSCEATGDGSCPSFLSSDDHISLQDGFAHEGEYEVLLKATAGGESAEARARIAVVMPSLPVIQVEAMGRLLNEGSTVELMANVSAISPSCTLSWYFAPSHQLQGGTDNNTGEDSEHGAPLGEPVSVHSMDESFLSELADFSNESEFREVRAHLLAAAGRARLLAECGCSETFSCEAEGAAYADVVFTFNPSPVPGEILVSPESGVALQTVFRLSTLAVRELHPPVRYSFYYTFNNGTRVLLSSYINYVAHENVLPYIEDGVTVLLEVCDVWGACGTAELLVHTTAVADDVIAASRLADTARAQLARCELLQLANLAVSALISFTNAQERVALDSYSSSLVQILREGAGKPCIQKHIRQYHQLLDLLAAAGLFDKLNRD